MLDAEVVVMTVTIRSQLIQVAYICLTESIVVGHLAVTKWARTEQEPPAIGFLARSYPGYIRVLTVLVPQGYSRDKV